MRSFIELQLDDSAKDAIRSMQTSWRDAVRGVTAKGCLRWTPVDNVHLTLRFLGETSPQQQEELSQRLQLLSQEWQPVALAIHGIGCFPNMRRPSVLWLGVDGDLQTLADLQSEVERIAEEAGFRPDKRRFSPHLTVARLRRGCDREEIRLLGNRVVQLVQEAEWAQSTFSFTAGRLIHMRSDLRPSGAVYTLLSSHSLTG